VNTGTESFGAVLVQMTKKSQRKNRNPDAKWSCGETKLWKVVRSVAFLSLFSWFQKCQNHQHSTWRRSSR